MVLFALYGTFPTQQMTACVPNLPKLIIRLETFMPLEQALLPMKLLKNRGYVAIVIVASIGQMALTALSILWPQQIENLYTTDNIKIGWMSVRVMFACGDLTAQSLTNGLVGRSRLAFL